MRAGLVNVRDAESDMPLAGAPPPIWYRGVPQRSAKSFNGPTHRSCAPEETLERIRPHLRAAGITRLADITGLDRLGLPCILAMRPNAPTLSNAAGKGFTHAAATVSAAMEGIEIYHAEVFDGDVVHETYETLDRAGLAPPLDLLCFARHNIFRADRAERWVPGWDLVEQREIFVPLEQISMNVAHLGAQTLLSFQAGSNGLAGGNTFLEAVCSALAELIERDATACARLADPIERIGDKVDLAHVPYARVCDLVEAVTAAGMSALLADLTNDLDVPTYGAWIVDTAAPMPMASGGYGAHLSTEVAMLRAITEAVQSRTIYVAGSRDDLMSLDHERMRRQDNTVFVDRAVAEGGVEVRAPLHGATFEEDCALLVDRVRAAELPHVIVVDLTRPELGIPVVRVVVPGLEGYEHFVHYAPGPRGRRAAVAA
jgi:ribosomal protein S12 methylthiotransferase accessory factor